MFRHIINLIDDDEEDNVEILDYKTKFMIQKDKNLFLTSTLIKTDQNFISINYELSKFKNLKARLKLYHLGRTLNNTLSGGFGGDITNPCLIPSIIKFIQENAVIPFIDSICDVGCGSGRVGVAFKSFFPYSSFIGIENNFEIAKIALNNLDAIDNKNYIYYGDAAECFFINYINHNENKYLNNISVVYSFNDANLGMDIGIYLSILKKNVKFMMITSFFKSILLYDTNIYEEIKNILGDFIFFSYIKLSGQQKKFKLMIFEITSIQKQTLQNRFMVVPTTENKLKSKGINYIIKRKQELL